MALWPCDRCSWPCSCSCAGAGACACSCSFREGKGQELLKVIPGKPPDEAPEASKMDLRRLKNQPKSLPGGLWGALGRVIGPRWPPRPLRKRLWGRSWRLLGPSWGRLGAVLRPSWGLLGSLGPILWPPGALWGPLGALQNRSKNRSENRSELVPDPGGPKSLWTYVSRCPRDLGDSPGLTRPYRKPNRFTLQNYLTGYPND